MNLETMVVFWLLLLIQKPQRKFDIHGTKEKPGLSFKYQIFQFMSIISLLNQKLLHYNSFFMELMNQTQTSNTKTKKTNLGQVEDKMLWYHLIFQVYTKDLVKDTISQILKILIMRHGDHMMMEDINLQMVAF